VSKCAATLAAGPDAASPRTEATLTALQLKHPPGDEAAALQAAEEAGWASYRAALAAAAAGDTEPLPTAADVFTSARLRSTIMTLAASAAAGLSGLSIQHL
jgi:hypothetical protein